METRLRVRMGNSDAHYGGNLVDGARRILALFGDAATELLVRHDGYEGLLGHTAAWNFSRRCARVILNMQFYP